MSFKIYMFNLLGAAFLIGGTPVLGMDLDLDDFDLAQAMSLPLVDPGNAVIYTGEDLGGFMADLNLSRLGGTHGPRSDADIEKELQDMYVLEPPLSDEEYNKLQDERYRNDPVLPRLKILDRPSPSHLR